jgi:hypothetical protein
VQGAGPVAALVAAEEVVGPGQAPVLAREPVPEAAARVLGSEPVQEPERALAESESEPVESAPAVVRPPAERGCRHLLHRRRPGTAPTGP